MSDVNKALVEALKRVDNDLMMFMSAGQCDPHCPRWADELRAEVQAALAAAQGAGESETFTQDDIDRAVLNEKMRMMTWCAKRQAISRKAWERAARKALAGNMAELRNRIDMIDAGPMDIALSDAQGAGPSDVAQAASVVLYAMNRAQIDMSILRLFMNGQPVAALTALSALTPGDAPAPWTPPEDRPDGYRCLGLIRGVWHTVSWWRVPGVWTIHNGNAFTPFAFAPLPPNPGDAP